MPIQLVIGLDAISSYRRLSYTPWHALAEFVDNSTQAYANNKAGLDAAFEKERDSLWVSIVYDRGEGKILISDNSSGMDRPDLVRALHVGLRPPNTSGRCKYGMGMKTAACWLGDHWNIRTKKLGCDTEYEAEVDVNRVASGDPDLREKAKHGLPMEKHYTIIEITRLHRPFKGRTLGRIKDFLRSMYRQDFRGGKLKLLWNGDPLSWQETAFLKAKDGAEYRRDFRFTIEGGKEAHGWVGILASGSRADAGFSVFHCDRVVRGWPDAWRPSTIYGQLQGSNDLINQRLVGEIHLDDFEVSQTKDDIQWVGEEQDLVEKKLEEECREYRHIANTYRKGADQRGPTNLETETAVQELQRELSSPELMDAIELAPVPDPEVAHQTFENYIEREKNRPVTLRASLGKMSIAVYLTSDGSENDPYYACDAAEENNICVVVNQCHPHWLQLSGSEGVLNYLRHCVYDALAEHQARSKAATVQPDTIKMFKDRYLRLPFEMERSASAADAAQPDEGSPPGVGL